MLGVLLLEHVGGVVGPVVEDELVFPDGLGEGLVVVVGVGGVFGGEEGEGRGGVYDLEHLVGILQNIMNVVLMNGTCRPLCR